MERVLLIGMREANFGPLAGPLQAQGYEVVLDDASQGVTQAELLVVAEAAMDDRAVFERLQQLQIANQRSPLLIVRTLQPGEEASPDSASRPSGLVAAARRALDRAAAAQGEALRPVLVGVSPAITELRRSFQRLLGLPRRAVLIKGEPGSGRETLARALHAQTMPNGEFAHVLDAEACDRVLLGQPRGGCGTLYLGELTELSNALQKKILRFFRASGALGNDAPEVRLVATCSANLERSIRERAVRPEVAYRFSVTLEIPPLRDRKEDIPALCEHLFTTIGGTGVRFKSMTPAALERLTEHDWPGNVRELASVLENASMLADTEELDDAHLPALSSRHSGVNFRLPAQGIVFQELEREILAQALRLSTGNQTRAAALLGLTRDQIRYRMAKFGMMRSDDVSEPKVA